MSQAPQADASGAIAGEKLKLGPDPAVGQKRGRGQVVLTDSDPEGDSEDNVPLNQRKKKKRGRQEEGSSKTTSTPPTSSARIGEQGWTRVSEPLMATPLRQAPPLERLTGQAAVD